MATAFLNARQDAPFKQKHKLLRQAELVQSADVGRLSDKVGDEQLLGRHPLHQTVEVPEDRCQHLAVLLLAEEGPHV